MFQVGAWCKERAILAAKVERKSLAFLKRGSLVAKAQRADSVRLIGRIAAWLAPSFDSCNRSHPYLAVFDTTSTREKTTRRREHGHDSSICLIVRS